MHTHTRTRICHLGRLADRAVEVDEELALCPPASAGAATLIKFWLLWPILLVLKLTLPDVRVCGKEYWWPVTLIGALSWVGLATYKVLQWAAVIGSTLGVPEAVMGMTFIAAGTSAPAVLTAMVVAQQGQAEATVSASIGARLLSLLVGLPVRSQAGCSSL